MSGDRDPGLRLEPPPRPRPAGGAGRDGDRRRAWGLALTAAGLLALTAAAGAVFLVLPDWLERRRAQVALLPAEAAVRAPEAAARPPEDPAQPVPVSREAAAPAAPPPAAAARPPVAGPDPPPVPAASSDPAPVSPTSFELAMGEALAADAAGDAAAAREAFARAVALEPESAPAAAGLARAEETLRSSRIAEHREAAREHAESERWRQALASYEAALALDPTLDFARQGAERARRRADLDEQLRFHLDRPGRLSSPEVRAEVGELLARAAAVADPGPAIRDLEARLAAQLERASSPVAVVVESDELTEVTVYRVGELGRFRRRTLELLPGTYVVVGRRSGYRDVRRELVVRSEGQGGEPLVVRCEEEI